MFAAQAAAVLLSLAGITWLDVPFVKQPRNDCGPAALWMVMSYWKTPAPAIQQIHGSVFSEQAHGVYASEMERYLASHGFQTWTLSGDWNTLRDNLLKGRPAIVALRGSPLHYVVVAGIDDTQKILFVNDSASRKLRAMHESEFEDRWRATNNWTLLALPTTESTAKPREQQDSAGAEESVQPNSAAVDPLERASAAFRREDYTDAKRYAMRAEKADPHQVITNELLATLYLLDGNVEAALKYWNRGGQPVVRNIDVAPQLEVDPVLLDRVFTFSRGSRISAADYLATRRRLDATGLFSNYTFDFAPAESNRFDLQLRGTPAGGGHFISWLAGLPYQTLKPRFTNLRKRTLNVDSLLRWDAAKRRAMVSLDGPMPRSDSIRVSATVDARDEAWIFHGTPLAVRRVDTTFLIHSPFGARGAWNTGFTSGSARLGYRGSLEYDLVRWPDHRFIASGGIRTELARNHSDRFAKVEPSLLLHWFPKARGSDFETTVQLRAGRASVATPVDELFILGLDRDTDLPLRAHSALSNGHQGAGPIGNRYVLLNAQTSKTLHDFGIARLAAGPFIDTARMSSVYVDSGLFLNLSVAGSVSFTFSVGRDLLTGHTVGFLN